LARRGFDDAEAAARALEGLQPLLPAATDLVALFAAANDPDQALRFVGEIAAGSPELFAHFAVDETACARLVAVCGASSALGQWLVVHPDDLAQLADDVPKARAVPERRVASEAYALSEASAASEARAVPGVPLLNVYDLRKRVLASANEPEPVNALRVANKRELLRIAAHDLTSPDPLGCLEEVAAALSHLADAVVEAAYQIAQTQVDDAGKCRLAVVAMGKCGAQELNYISDVDVIYVAEPADEKVSRDEAILIGTKLAAAIARICSEYTATGTIWPLDAALRPEGNAGPLVRTLDSMGIYYDKWASDWEFQAMLKARPMAGDLALGEEFLGLITPLVWRAGERPGFVAASRAMRQRVVSLIPAGEADRELKLGTGGLRDIEFSAQILQLVHGRSDERLRVRATLPALRALSDYGYIGREDGERLAQAYRFIRLMEHRVQLSQLHRTHLFPAATDASARRSLARALRSSGPEKLWTAWRETSTVVRTTQQRVFFSPLLEAVSRIPSDEMRLTSDAAEARMRALGFGDAAAALRHIEALTRGVSRAAEIQRQLMPAMLGWLAEGPNPDAGLLAFRNLSEALGNNTWYLRGLRDEGTVAQRLARVLSSSRYIVDLLRRDPAAVELLSENSDLTPRPSAELRQSFIAAALRQGSATAGIESVRALRRRELFRISVGEVLGTLDVSAVGQALSELAGAVFDAALALATAERTAAREAQPPSAREAATPIGVISMGRWGGAEMSYGSDADCMFVVGDAATNEQLAEASTIVTRASELLRIAAPNPLLDVDPDLRPEGRDGALVRSLSSYVNYYSRWSLTWEAQALVRASFGAGDACLVAEFLGNIAPIRWPEAGLSQEQVTDIRKLKVRIDNERGGKDRSRNLKLGPGGLSDVEWCIQMLQLRHAHDVDGLRTTSTMGALDALINADLMDEISAAHLRGAWEFASRIRNAITLARGRSADTLPSDAHDLAAVAMLLGYTSHHEAAKLLDDWQHAARLASHVVDKYFWGL
jgi:glutamate-ammonia-ligase adenylyltransferase